MFEVCGLFLEVVRFSNRTRNQAPRSVVTWVARSWSPLRCCQQLGTSAFYGSVFWQLLIHIQSSITYHTYSYRGWACWYAQGDFVVSCISLEFSWICFSSIYKQALSSAPPFNNTCTRLVSPQALRHAHGEIGKVKSNLVWTNLCILYIHNIYIYICTYTCTENFAAVCQEHIQRLIAIRLQAVRRIDPRDAHFLRENWEMQVQVPWPTLYCKRKTVALRAFLFVGSRVNARQTFWTLAWSW